MKQCLFLFPLLAAALLPSCSAVSTQTPVTEKTEISLQGEFRGSWIMDEGIVHLDFDAQGVGHLAATSWDGDKFKTDHGIFHAVRSDPENNQGFISAKDKGDNEFLFCAFKLTDAGEIVLWVPDPLSNFGKLVDDGQLAGKTEEKSDSVTIVDGPKLLTKIDDLGNYFDLEDPVILRRALPKIEKNAEPPAE